ncbi:glyoxylate/hydroxypyruvate reductase A [Inquilinus limosus]|uniref:2-hydroxyacid dehydrogenase n=1 Tax=Inquilinus limosus TaxID=171674 RepID=UPI003F151B91
MSAPTVLLLSTTLDLGYLVEPMQAALPGADVRLWPDVDPEAVEMAICWRPPAGVLARMPRLRLIHSIGAGVDHITADPELPDRPLCRMIDGAMAAGIREYVLWSVLYFHRDFDLAARQRELRLWETPPPVPARNWTVGVLGLGAIGLGIAPTLRDLGYRVRGWSRSPKRIEGVECFAGPEGLAPCIEACDMVVSILPLTAETRRLFDRRVLARMKPGAAFVNVGRGEQLVLDDLLGLLDEGHLRGAVLDVFEVEPLPSDHPAWRHPAVVVTPHMASRTDRRDIARQAAENYRRAVARQPLIGLVERDRGY